jgi:uncharacterized protein (TIGR04141 family)
LSAALEVDVLAQVTIFRIDPSIDDPDAIVDPGRRPWSTGVRMQDGTVAVLHVKRSIPKEAEWMSFFPTVDFEGIHPFSASSGAVLILKRPVGYFAVVFGFGRYMLREGVTDERFGLRVVLNAMEPTLLRSLDHKRLDAVPRHTREQLSKAGVLGQFGLDIERDMLRGLTATPKDSRFGDRLTGADSLSVAGQITLEKLPALIDEYATLSEKADYKAVFPWVDNIAEIRDKRLKTKLDEAAVAALKEGSAKLWLGLPEVVSWQDVKGFAYTRGRHAEVRDDLSLELYSADNAALSGMTVTRLDADIVRCVSAVDGSDLRSWSIRKCLIGEVEHDGEVFVISEGQWFRVSRDFLEQIERDIAAIPRRYAGILPKCGGRSERAYNERAARRSNGALHLLDRDLVHFPPRGAVEICDLYDRDRTFIHVKKYGASSVLSHLFAQGWVSAELFSQEPDFRRAVWEKLPPPYQWGDPTPAPTMGQFGVCFGIMCRAGCGLDLPVFSKVNLRKEARHLRQLGFEVSLAEIPN